MRLTRDELGLSTIEYIIIMVLVMVVGIISWQVFGTTVEETVEEAHTEITALGVNGMGGSAGGSGGTSSGVGGSADIERAPGAEPGDPAGTGSTGSESSMAAETGGGGAAGDDTEAAGIVRDDGAIAVYTAPGVEEESSYGFYLTIAIVILLILGAIFGVAKFRKKTG